MRAMVHSHVAPCEPCDQIGTGIQLDTKLDKKLQIFDFKYRPCIENPRVGGSIPPLGTIYHFKSISYSLVDFKIIASNT
jgi:hypothetical protein